MLQRMPNLLEIRAGLAAARRARRLSLDVLQRRSGVDRMTIHKIEHVSKYPALEPGLDTVQRLVEGMGLTLGQFFTSLEGEPEMAEANDAEEADHAAAVERFVAAFRAVLATSPQQPGGRDLESFLRKNPPPIPGATGTTRATPGSSTATSRPKRHPRSGGSKGRG